MKVSPVANSTPTINPNEGMSANPSRIERAKSVMEGRQPDPASQDPQAARIEKKRSIKMNTNASPDKFVTAEPVLEPVTDTPSLSEPSLEPEEIKPLSPQFAALAREKRAFQIEKANFEKTKVDNQASADLIARIKSKPLDVLKELDVTYDKLTEDLIASDDPNAQIARLEAKLEALEKGTQSQAKTALDREAAVEKQLEARSKAEADRLIVDNDAYEMVRTAGATADVAKLITEVKKRTGETLSVSAALDMVEDQLIEDNLKIAQTKKLQSRINGTQTAQPRERTMKTLTSRDGGTLPMSSKERAILAFQGKLTR